MHTLPLATAESFLLTYAFNALWQVPLIFAAAHLAIWLAARASRPAGPAFQHALWTTALFAELLLPALSATPAELLQSAQTWLASFRHTTPALGPQVTVTMGEAHVATGFQLPPTFLLAAAILYLAAVLFFATRLAIGLHQTTNLRRRAQPLTLTGHARQSYHRFAQLFAVPDAHVATSNDIASPITLGIRRPALLLPAHFDTLLEEDLDAALAHEFAHLCRHDFAKNLAYELLSLPIAFHPILWLTRARMNESREVLCDAMAASAVAGPQRYARSLLRLATQFSQSPQAPTPHAIGIFDAHPFKNFERRVMNLTHRTIELRGAARLIPAALSLVLIASACTTALAFRQQVAAPPASTPPTQTAALQPIALAIPPASAATTQAEPGNQLHVSAGVIAGQRLSFVNPVYPPDAKKAKLSGTVVLHAIIGRDGTIKTLDVASSTNPVFNDSALEAVKQWTYKPYLLNGEPTAVDTNITINYALNPSPEPEPSPNPNPSAANPQPSASNQVLHIGGDVKPPVMVHMADPEYSPQAKAAKFSGTVRVYLLVDADGHTSHIRVVKGVGMGLDEKAVEAVSRYQFKPATLRGKPVPVDLYVDVNFQIL